MTSLIADQAGFLGTLPGGWYSFQDSVATLEAWSLQEVIPVLHQVEQWTQRGYYAVGFITYEASPALDPAIVTHPPLASLPLLWFRIYRNATPFAQASFVAKEGGTCLPSWHSEISIEEYQTAFSAIKQYIAEGKTYQVNYTYRLTRPQEEDPWTFFQSLSHAQGNAYAAYLQEENWTIASASPELFFQYQQGQILCRPMKGTLPRGVTLSQDNQQALRLTQSEKDRAENIMIVDMIRHDLSKIAKLGTVRTLRRFTPERYHTLWQMTSTITAQTDCSLVDIFRTLFPCASITGAPKIKTSQWIAQLEKSPRGIYTGAIGYITPRGEAQFNVAIRTALFCHRTKTISYGIGSGITWDSLLEQESKECQLKSKILLHRRPHFHLLETLLWHPERGYHLLTEHLQRMRDSAYYFAFPFDLVILKEALLCCAQKNFSGNPQTYKVRCMVDSKGAIAIESTPFPYQIPVPWQVALAKEPVDSTSWFLYHKTTHRPLYHEGKKEFPGHDDIIFWNQHGEVTESTVANVIVKIGAEWLTPPITCGLLAGTARQYWLGQGILRESIITCDQLILADKVYLLNSVRGWIATELS